MPALATPAGRALLLIQSGYRYLLLARFSTDIAAPLPASLPVDVGTLTTVQVDGQLSQSGGKLVFPAQATPAAYEDQFIRGSSLLRLAGRALLGDLNYSTHGFSALGWSNSPTLVNPAGSMAASVYTTGGSVGIRTSVGLAGGLLFATLSTGTVYQFVSILRSTGCFVLIKGGSFTNWTLLWVHNQDSTATLYPAFTNFDSIGTLDNFRVLDLAQIATDAQVYTNRLVSPIAGTATTHAADALIEFTFSYAGAVMYFQYRRTSATNSWEVDADTGSVTLFQVVAGVYTSRGTVGSTFAATNTYRVVIVAEGNVHKVYVNNVLKITYTDAGNFQNTATGISVDAVSASMSEVIAWPRTVALPNV